MKSIVKFAKVTAGELYPYLKDLRLVGRIDGNKFYLYGCHDDDQAAFYKGVFEYDKATGYIGFESPEDVEQQWMVGMNIILVIEEFEVIREGNPCKR